MSYDHWTCYVWLSSLAKHVGGSGGRSPPCKQGGFRGAAGTPNGGPSLQRGARDSHVLGRLANRTWREVLKPRAERGAGVREALPHLGREEGDLRRSAKQGPLLSSACLATVTEEQRK